MTRKVKVLKIILVVICSLILFVGCNDKNEEIDNDIINDETEVKEIILNKKSINIKVGQKNTIKAVIKPENATDKKIIWTSSDSKIVKVDSEGNINAISKGNATITTKSSNGISASCVIIVEQLDGNSTDIKVTGIKIMYGSKASDSLDVNKDTTITLKAIVEPTNANNKKVEWTSSNNSVATVNNGKVTTKKKGITVITAIATDGSKTKDKITIRVIDEDSDKKIETIDVKKKYLDALRATARAYLNRGEAIQYDGSSLTLVGQTGNYGSDRFSYYFSPEEATMQYKKYTVCSSFVFQLFKSTFDNYIINGTKNSNTSFINSNSSTPNLTLISKPGSKFYNEDLAVFYIDKDTYYKRGRDSKPSYFINGKNPTVDTNDKYDKDKASKLREDIMSIIEPGDVIVYKRGNTGHVVVYLGNNEVIESFYPNSKTGVYDFANKRDKLENPSNLISKNYDGSTTYGTIHTWNLVKRENDSSDQSVLGENYRHLSESNESIAIIRPFDEIEKNGYKVSKSAEIRINYPDLYMEKTSSIISNGKKYTGRYGLVDKNGSIIFTIKLKNNSKNTYKKIEIIDEAPVGTMFEINNPYCKLENNSRKIICKDIEISNGKTLNITYNLKILSSYSNNYIEMKNTTVNGLKLTNTITYVGKTLTKKELDTLTSQSKNPDKNLTGSMIYIQDIYENIGINLPNNLSNFIKDLFYISGNITESNNPTGKSYTYTSNGVKNVINTGRIKICANNQKKDNCILPISVTNNLNKDIEYDIYWPKSNNTYSDMIIPGMYGGILTLDYFNRTNKTNEDFSKDFTARQRFRYVEENDFMDGDILIINNGTLSNSNLPLRKQIAYIYIDGKFKTVKKVNNKYTIYELQDVEALLEGLIGEENFVVLRPSVSK